MDYLARTSVVLAATWPRCNSVGRSGCRFAGRSKVRFTLPSKREARVLFGFHNGMLIALHSFIKKTEATPPDDLSIARQRLKEVSS